MSGIKTRISYDRLRTWNKSFDFKFGVDIVPLNVEVFDSHDPICPGNLEA
jgi:hypothetical protein